MLNKAVGDDATCAESWEICDHGSDQSIVVSGPLTGTSLAQLVRERGSDLLGRHAPQSRFPLLYKFLDGAKNFPCRCIPTMLGPLDCRRLTSARPKPG